MPSLYSKMRSDTQPGDVRPTMKQKANGKEFGWRGFELKHGYFIIEDDPQDLQGISPIDDMGTFKSITSAEAQAAKDGFRFIHLTKQQINTINAKPIASYVLTEDHVLDTPRNRRLLKGII